MVTDRRSGRRWRWFAFWVALGGLALAGCGAPDPEGSAIGGQAAGPGDEYIGTWSRGNDRVRSVIAIVRDGENLLFRWQQRTRSENWRVDCDWDGHCEEFVDGEKMGDHYFESWLDPESGHLMVECRSEVFKPSVLRSRYVDELVVEEDGKTLWSYTIERDGTVFPVEQRPRRSFQKTSDAVAHPPR